MISVSVRALSSLFAVARPCSMTVCASTLSVLAVHALGSIVCMLFTVPCLSCVQV